MFDDVMTPADMGGTPAVMQSNSWWDLGSQAIKTAADIAMARISSGTRAAQSGVLPTNAQNIPPGMGGINFQAAATPGGQPTASRIGTALGAMPAWLVLGVALALGAVLALAMRRR